MIRRCCNFSDILISTDQFLEKVPVVRNVVAIINLIMKTILNCIPNECVQSIKYFAYICNKDTQQLMIQAISLTLIKKKPFENPLPLTSPEASPELPVLMSHLMLSSDEILQAVFIDGKKNPDLQNPEIYVTYRGLSDDKRTQVRKLIYERLTPLIKSKEIYLPCISGYDGESLYISLEDNRLAFRGVLNNKDLYFMSIEANGQTEFQPVYTLSNHIIKIKNEIELLYDTDNYEIRNNFKDSYYYEGSPGQWFYRKNTNERERCVETQYHAALAKIELITMKFDQIEEFLKKGNHGVAEQVFRSCQSIFDQVEMLPFKKTASSHAVAVVNPSEEILTLGPLTSPMNSQDSTFVWKITKSKTETSLSFEKQVGGRPFHSSSNRNLTLTKPHNSPNAMKVTINKSEKSADHDSKTETVYTLTMKDGKLLITPDEKTVKAFYSFPFVMFDPITGSFDGFDPFIIDTTAIPTAKELKDDIEWVMKSLTTVGDMYRSPHTLIIPEDAETAYNLKGQAMPKKYIEQRLAFNQGIYGGSVLWTKAKKPETLHGRVIKTSN